LRADDYENPPLAPTKFAKP